MQFLTNLNLNQNELQNARVQNVSSDPATGSSVAGQIIFNTTSNVFKYFDGAQWVAAGAGSIVSFDFQTDDSNTTTVNDSDTIIIAGGTSGIDTSISGDTITISLADITNAELQNDSIDITNSDGHLIIGNSGTVALGGSIAIETQNLVDTIEDQTVGGNKTFSGDTIFNGDVTINGTTTTVDSTNLLVEDPLIVVAKNQTGASPSLDAGLVVERGDADSMGMFWDESDDEFVFANISTEDGSTAGDVAISSYVDVKMGNLETTGQLEIGNVPSTGSPSHFLVRGGDNLVREIGVNTLLQSEAVTDVTGSGNAPITVTVTEGGAGDHNVDVDIALATDGDARTGTTEDVVLTPASLRATEHVDTVTGDGSATSHTITHNMGTTDVFVQVYEVTTGETVYPEITRTSTSVVTIGITPAAPLNKEYKVLIKTIA